MVGLLQHATRVVRFGRTFTARMYATAARTAANIVCSRTTFLHEVKQRVQVGPGLVACVYMKFKAVNVEATMQQLYGQINYNVL